MKRPTESGFQRFLRFLRTVARHTALVRMGMALVSLWLLFGCGLYWAESGHPESRIHALGDALYWGVAAFSTAGIADAPVTGAGKLIGAFWIVIGSVLFFGIIVATVTAYFMRPLQRPHKTIIDAIEYNLEQLEDLNVEELDLLKDTVDALIVHVESLKGRTDR